MKRLLRMVNKMMILTCTMKGATGTFKDCQEKFGCKKEKRSCAPQGCPWFKVKSDGGIKK
jgi:hypothetical protein